MRCKSPNSISGSLYPCGKCMQCRISKRRMWTHRLLLESQLWSSSAYVTLTYAPEFQPFHFETPKGRFDSVLPTLNPRDAQLFMKRLRRNLEGVDYVYNPQFDVDSSVPQFINPLRFYLVGEYGDDTERPHYHIIVFNSPTCARGRTNHVLIRDTGSCCPTCDLYRSIWGRGGVDLGVVERESIQYVAGYVTKKMTSKSDARLLGRHPEFARMSNRPGIGANAVDMLSEAMVDPVTGEIFGLDDNWDVPVSLRQGGSLLPLGRYLRNKLRIKMGIPDDVKKISVEKIQKEMQDVYYTALCDEIEKKGTSSLSLKKFFEKKNQNRSLMLEWRDANLKNGKTI